MKQTIKTADKIIKLDQEPNQHRGLQKKIEKEVSKFRSLNKTTSLLQIAMQENIAKVIGTSHEAQKISSYSEFFEKVKTNAQFLLQATDKQLRS
jgi:tyrosine-protein phosphatase YwqE